MKIGPYKIANQVVAAPMAGVTDKPYRQLCRQHGVAMTVSEMITSRADLRHSTKTRFRMDLTGEPEPVVVQIVGTDPQTLATAAQNNVANGAQIIDINMGCPAKKVCNKAAGSALLENEPLVSDILKSVVHGVDVPVTVKIRTGTTPSSRNAVTIAKIAEDAGVQALTIHGRTRQCKFVGAVEYDTIAEVCNTVKIPVIANGDISSPTAALNVLNQTAADAIMVGRAAQGQPWLFQQIVSFLADGTLTPIPNIMQRAAIITNHVQAIHIFYGERLGVKFARKHIKWYLAHWEVEIEPSLRNQISTTESTDEQVELLQIFLAHSIQNHARAIAA